METFFFFLGNVFFFSPPDVERARASERKKTQNESVFFLLH